MNIYSIYRITNLITNKVYIGYTSNPETRWYEHCYSMNLPEHSRKKLYRSMLKNGIDNFKFEVIYQSYDKQHTKNVMENYFITEYDSYANGYNMTLGGDGGPGVTSKNATKYNNERIANGTHNFLSDKAKQIASDTAKETNAKLVAAGSHHFQSQEYIELNARLQQQKVACGSHYFQSEESKQFKRELMAYKCNRPILKELQGLYKLNKLNARNLHTWSDEKIVARIVELSVTSIQKTC